LFCRSALVASIVWLHDLHNLCLPAVVQAHTSVHGLILPLFLQFVKMYVEHTLYRVSICCCYYYYPNFSLLSFSWEIFTYPGMYHQQD
jgi:hypothetical protein